MEAVHKTAVDLHRLVPVPEYDSAQIRLLRDRYQLSQAVLAALLKWSVAGCRWLLSGGRGRWTCVCQSA